MLLLLQRPSNKVREGPSMVSSTLVSVCASLAIKHDPLFKTLVSSSSMGAEVHTNQFKHSFEPSRFVSDIPSAVHRLYPGSVLSVLSL